jgi:hypothetical protein
MPIDPAIVPEILKLGASGVLFLSMAIAIKVLWQENKDKDKQIFYEREKREELIKESTKTMAIVVETMERIVESNHRIELEVNNARHRD